MANLVEDLGSSYFSQSMSGAVFLYQGTPHLFGAMGRSTHAEAYQLEMLESPRTACWGPPRLVPSQVFESFSVFAAPKLGYRNYLDGNGTTVLVHLSSMRSTRRGFRAETTQVRTVAPVNARVGVPQGAGVVACAYDMSSFLTYQDALASIRSGALLGVAMSPDLALVADYSSPGGYMSILFRGQKVADVDEYGNIHRASKAFRTTKHYLNLVKKGEAL